MCILKSLEKTKKTAKFLKQGTAIY